MCCSSCPFAFTDESEYVQNLGCLPEPFELVEMKRKTGHNWSCHEEPRKLCGGFARHIKEYHKDLDVKKGFLINSKVWLEEGEDVAIALANRGIDESRKQNL